MRVRRAALIACSVALAASCSSPSEPPEEPDLRGVWSGGRAWYWSTRNDATPNQWGVSQCAGDVDITEQEGASFTGRYAITCTSGSGSAGRVDGRVGSDGQLSFRLETEQGMAPGLLPAAVGSLDCPVVSDSVVYEGTVAYGPLSAHRFQELDCPSGRIRVSASFEGARR
jgi:hypothetical protein